MGKFTGLGTQEALDVLMRQVDSGQLSVVAPRKRAIEPWMDTDTCYPPETTDDLRWDVSTDRIREDVLRCPVDKTGRHDWQKANQAVAECSRCGMTVTVT